MSTFETRKSSVLFFVSSVTVTIALPHTKHDSFGARADCDQRYAFCRRPIGSRVRKIPLHSEARLLRTLIPSSTMYAATIAFVDAMAAMMFPAISLALNGVSASMWNTAPRRLL